MKKPQNFVLYPRWMIAVEPDCRVQENRGIVVVDGKIADILSRQDCELAYRGLPAYELDQHLLLPGLINMHTHAAMTLLRGYADDQPLMDWLQKHIWPAEGRWVDAEFVRDGTQLAIAEMIQSGTTTFSDQYFFPDVAAQAALESGMRCQIVFPVMDFPTAWARNADEYIHLGLKLYDQYRSSSQISVGFGPHAPYTLSDESLQRVATLAGELDTVIQIHLHETAGEIAESVATHGERPMARMQRLGILGPRTQCVHMTQIADKDMELIKRHNLHLVHCPSSNMKLASGNCPVDKMLEAGINLCIGTDGAASNNRLDMIEEMRLAALLAKSTSAKPTAMNASQALTAVTLNAAKALGMDSQIGSLRKGKQADIIAVRLDSAGSLPVYNALSQLVYSTNGSQVSHSWVAGRQLMDQRQLQTLHMASITKRARNWAERIRGASND